MVRLVRSGSVWSGLVWSGLVWSGLAGVHAAHQVDQHRGGLLVGAARVEHGGKHRALRPRLLGSILLGATLLALRIDVDAVVLDDAQGRGLVVVVDFVVLVVVMVVVVVVVVVVEGS